METPYKAVSFSKHDTITKQDMDQLQNNYQWIKDNTPRGQFYRAEKNIEQTLLVLVAGKRLIRRHPKTDSAKVAVKFGKVFAPDCRPAVTTGVVADFQKKIHCVVNGPGKTNYPNATGFEINVNIAGPKDKKGTPVRRRKDVIKKPFWVHWQAMGYRTDNLREF